MTPTPNLTLQDLADQTGIEPRTIRSWIQQGLLAGPETGGRYARYNEQALDRLWAIKALRDFYGMTLTSIRHELLVSDDQRIAALAKEGRGAQMQNPDSPDLTAAGNNADPAPAGTTALEYLRALRASGSFAGPGSKTLPSDVVGTGTSSKGSKAIPAMAAQPAPASPLPDDQPPPPSSRSRLVAALETFERSLKKRQIPRKAKGEVQLKIPVTPDIELTIRGRMTPEDIAQYERLADLLKELLQGDLSHD